MKVFIKLFCLLVCLPNIKSDCLIQYDDKMNNAPKFEKFVGKYKIKIHFSENTNYINLQNGETIHAYCDTYFSPISYIAEGQSLEYYYGRAVNRQVDKIFSNETDLVLECRGEVIFYNDNELVDQIFKCMEQTWSVYSTKTPYNWCDNNKKSVTFLFAAQETANVLAAFCYNLNEVSLKTFVYNTISLKRNYMNRSVGFTTNNTISSEYLDENIWNFKTSIVSELSKELFQEKITEMGQTDEWLNLAKYELSLIAQDELLMQYLREYEDTLNIIWWHNLRVGNWKQFQNTLANYTSTNIYEVYIGTSGIAQYPTNANCIKERYLKFKLDSQNVTVPAYIWTYLKSNDKLNEEFVIIGYNSPYTEYFGIEKIIFCPDICSEILWLKKVSASFRYSYAGIMFCCSTEFIRQTDYLEGFPVQALLSQEISTTSEETTSEDYGTTTSEDNEYDMDF